MPDDNIATIKEIVENLNENPTEANWEALSKVMKKGGAKYYRIFYPSGSGGKSGRAQTYAVLYDAKYRSMFRVPIYDRSGKKLGGATEYLKELALNTKVGEQPAIKHDEDRERIMRKLRSLGYM